MFDRQVTSAGQFDDRIHRLTDELAHGQANPDQSIFERALQGIRSIDPFVAAGVLTSDDNHVRWMAIESDDSEKAILRRILDQLPDRIRRAVHSGKPDQLPVSEVEGSYKGDSFYFAGMPAGQFGDDRLGIGYLCKRKLSDDELSSLAPFSQVIGLAAENERLTNLLEQRNGYRSVAQLIGLIAHELRTPLTGIRGNIQLALMSNRKGQHERVPNRLESAIASVDNMASLVQKLLDVSRLERGIYPFQAADSDLRKTTSAAIEEVLSVPDIELPGIVLSQGNPVEHHHDHQALQRALSYLLQTVMQYVRHDGEITVTIHNQEPDRAIEISYQGDQLSEPDQVALSAPLYEGLDREDFDTDHDLSLELAFLRGIVLHHRGRIELQPGESKEPEQRVTVWLPVV